MRSFITNNSSIGSWLTGKILNIINEKEKNERKKKKRKLGLPCSLVKRNFIVKKKAKSCTSLCPCCWLTFSSRKVNWAAWLGLDWIELPPRFCNILLHSKRRRYNSIRWNSLPERDNWPASQPTSKSSLSLFWLLFKT